MPRIDEILHSDMGETRFYSNILFRIGNHIPGFDHDLICDEREAYGVKVYS
jgi:hypothetical protein